MRNFMNIVEEFDGSKIFWTTIVFMGIVYVVSGIQSRDWREE